MRHTCLVLAALLFSHLGSLAGAGPIGTGAFVNPVVDDFTGLGLPVNNTGPLVRPEGTYTFQPATFRYLDLGGSPFFHEAIGTDFQTGYIDLVLNQPTVRAGAWLGASSGTIEFFNPSGASLGSINYSEPGTLSFYGWDSGGDLIARIRVTDTNALDGAITFLDRTTTEAVPEPASLGLLACGAVLLLRSRIARATRRSGA